MWVYLNECNISSKNVLFLPWKNCRQLNLLTISPRKESFPLQTLYLPVLSTETLSRNERGRFGALKSYSTHHFFRNACTKSGSWRFSQFSGCWLILSVYILMSFDFPFVRLFGVRFLTLLKMKQNAPYHINNLEILNDRIFRYSRILRRIYTFHI
jgi:hypothetical protein